MRDNENPSQCPVCEGPMDHWQHVVDFTWRPIETAPKDGTEFQAWVDKYGWEPKARVNPETEAVELWGRTDYDQDGWDVYFHMTVTHWMPTPEGPK